MSIWTSIPAPHVPSPALPVLAVGSLKGGVGKTSVVAYLAYALVHMGYRVLAIDLDFQGSLSSALSRALPVNDADGAINVLLSSSEEVFFDRRVVSEGYPPWQKLTAVRATFELADVEDRLFAGLILGKPEDARFLLAKKLSEPRLRNDFDIVLIDTPPRLTVGSLNALCACTHVLIPTSPTVLAVSGAITFVDILEHFQKALALRLRILAVLPTLAIQSKLSNRENKILDNLSADIPGVEIWRELHIPHKSAIADNKNFNDPIIEGLFTALALKVEGAVGLNRHGSDAHLKILEILDLVGSVYRNKDGSKPADAIAKLKSQFSGHETLTLLEWISSRTNAPKSSRAKAATTDKPKTPRAQNTRKTPLSDTALCEYQQRWEASSSEEELEVALREIEAVPFNKAQWINLCQVFIGQKEGTLKGAREAVRAHFNNKRLKASRRDNVAKVFMQNI